jgi:RNA polymerase sigma factor (sigma-70 family)
MATYRSDPALIQACRGGDHRAWDRLIDRYSRLVYSIPRRYGLSEADAEDVFQSVFTILVRKLETLQDDTRLSAWLITTTHRECWRHGRRAGAQAPLEALPEDPDSPGDQTIDRLEEQHLVREALQRLGGRCERLLTALFRSGGDSGYERIAADLGMKIGSIGPTRARCFDKLRAILLEMGYEPDMGAPCPPEDGNSGRAAGISVSASPRGDSTGRNAGASHA